MQSQISARERILSPAERTIEAVRRQVAAMASEVFEIGLFKPDAAGNEAVMLPRVWDADTLLRSVAWLRHQNRDGRNIYIRPRGEHNLSLIDDLSRDAVIAMKQAGFAPAAVIETSPGNFQAWVKHPEQLSKELGTAIRHGPSAEPHGPYRVPTAIWSLLRSLLFRGAVKRLDTPRNGQRIGTSRSRSSFKLLGSHPRSGRTPGKGAGLCHLAQRSNRSRDIVIAGRRRARTCCGGTTGRAVVTYCRPCRCPSL